MHSYYNLFLLGRQADSRLMGNGTTFLTLSAAVQQASAEEAVISTGQTHERKTQHKMQPPRKQTRGLKGAPFSIIRRTGFAGSRRIFAEQSLPCGSKNSFLTDFPPGSEARGKSAQGVAWAGEGFPRPMTIQRMLNRHSLFVCARSTISCAIRWISAFIRWMQSISRHWPFTMSSAKVSQVGDPQEPQS